MNSNDKTDAFWLAHLQRLAILPTGYIHRKEQRGARDLLRRRMLLVQQRTAHLLSFKSPIERETGESIVGNKALCHGWKLRLLLPVGAGREAFQRVQEGRKPTGI